MLISKYVGSELFIQGLWCDPFAGENSPAQIQNDLSGKCEFKMDALEFLKTRKTNEFDGVLYDPPYSITQARQCYEGRGPGVTSFLYSQKSKRMVIGLVASGLTTIVFHW